MKDEVLKKEREKYEAIWKLDEYRERSPGMRFLDDALAKLQPPVGASFLDIGCGTGRVSNELQQRGFDVTAMDIADNACREFSGVFVCCCIWDMEPGLGPFDYGFCADVMEHIPPERVDETLEAIAKVCKTVYFQIANFHDHFGEAIGESLHLTVENCEWWNKRLTRYFKQVQITAEPKHHVAVCSNW